MTRSEFAALWLLLLGCAIAIGYYGVTGDLPWPHWPQSGCPHSEVPPHD